MVSKNNCEHGLCTCLCSSAFTPFYRSFRLQQSVVIAHSA